MKRDRERFVCSSSMKDKERKKLGEKRQRERLLKIDAMSPTKRQTEKKNHGPNESKRDRERFACRGNK